MLEKTRDELSAGDDTIVAVATPDGRGAIGIVRVSGPEAASIVSRFFRSREPYAPRRARLGSFGPPGGPSLDQVLVTVFEGPRSYTGEDVAEISAHGNPFNLKQIEQLVVSGGARRARRGEFTFRAVANGKIDLAQAEAVRDFVEAETEAQARLARRQMDGAVSGRLRPERDALVGVVAELEAGIDFAEDDIESPAPEALAGRLEAIAGRVGRLAGSFHYGRLLTGGLLLAIIGRPNVGKSSLFNRLVSHDRAIVTEVPGTTRDVLTETVAISGVPIRVADTAGVRRTSEPVESLGVKRSLETAAESDLTILVLDGSRPLTAEDLDLSGQLRESGSIVVVNKADLPSAWTQEVAPRPVRLSALTGEGFDGLERAIAEWIGEFRPPDADGFIITSHRQHEALREAVGHLEKAAGALRRQIPHELALVDVYQALAALGQVTGEVTHEDILDQIFSTFCIGK